jgi:hypothetical protein
MMRYLCLLYVEERKNTPGAPGYGEVAAANLAANKAMAEAGVLLEIP